MLAIDVFVTVSDFRVQILNYFLYCLIFFSSSTKLEGTRVSGASANKLHNKSRVDFQAGFGKHGLHFPPGLAPCRSGEIVCEGWGAALTCEPCRGPRVKLSFCLASGQACWGRWSVLARSVSDLCPLPSPTPTPP